MDLALDLVWLAEKIGDSGAAALGGLLVGLLFGACAQRSAFCLRSATIEFWGGTFGPKVAIWLLVFGTALLGTQVLMETGQLDSGSIRQLTQPGTLSGAIIGGLMFGAGMILARGCASRLLVLSATGNLRALVSGLILTVVAQASLRGALSPARQSLSSIWLIDADARNLMNQVPEFLGAFAGFTILVMAFAVARSNKLSPVPILASIGVGAAVVFGWWFTSLLSAQAFETVAVQSVTFTGPSADTLMVFINRPDFPLSFGIGLVPGVFAGSLLASLVDGGFQVQSFNENARLPRYIAGACLMGFGSMLAGGCAVGAGVTGGGVLALTAWVALTAMWAGAGITHACVDLRRTRSAG